MHENELFPLDAVPYRVKLAILHEFKGHAPTVLEVARICDKGWLAVPGIGRTALACIRQATGDLDSSSDNRSAARMSDAELLTRLERLQEELQSLNRVLNATLPLASKKVRRSGRMRKNSLMAHEQQSSSVAF